MEAHKFLNITLPWFFINYDSKLSVLHIRISIRILNQYFIIIGQIGRDGLDEDGSDEDGLDEDGLDDDGLDKDGLDKDGLDEDGVNEDGM